MEKLPIVISNGSFAIKAGFSGDKQPRCIKRTLYGRIKPEYRDNDDLKEILTHETFVCDDALQRSKYLNLNNPMKNGYINKQNWDQISEIWEHIFRNELMSSMTHDHPILLIEKSTLPKTDRETYIHLMFENFGFSKFFIASQPVCALIATGKTTGVVLDCGHSMSQCIPIYECLSLQHAIETLNIGGKHINEYLKILLQPKSMNNEQEIDENTLLTIKTRTCFVSPDYQQMLKSNPQKLQQTFKLPDGNTITIDQERIMAPEILFDPNLYFTKLEIKNNNDVNNEKITGGLSLLLYNSITKCNDSLMNDLYQNILLTGGGSLFSGLKDRLIKEINSNHKNELKDILNINAPLDRAFGAWIGGSIISNNNNWNDIWISKEEYSEFGSGIVYRKCLMF